MHTNIIYYPFSHTHCLCCRKVFAGGRYEKLYTTHILFSHIIKLSFVTLNFNMFHFQFLRNKKAFWNAAPAALSLMPRFQGVSFSRTAVRCRYWNMAVQPAARCLHGHPGTSDDVSKVCNLCWMTLFFCWRQHRQVQWCRLKQRWVIYRRRSLLGWGAAAPELIGPNGPPKNKARRAYA
jgi:hypothetical protein